MAGLVGPVVNGSARRPQSVSPQSVSPFHVKRSGLALLVAYLLHLIQIRYVAIPT